VKNQKCLIIKTNIWLCKQTHVHLHLHPGYGGDIKHTHCCTGAKEERAREGDAALSQSAQDLR